MLPPPKNRSDKKETCGAIYKIKYKGYTGHACLNSYEGEIERLLKARFVKHRRPSKTISDVSRHIHKLYPGHRISLESVKY